MHKLPIIYVTLRKTTLSHFISLERTQSTAKTANTKIRKRQKKLVNNYIMRRSFFASLFVHLAIKKDIYTVRRSMSRRSKKKTNITKLPVDINRSDAPYIPSLDQTYCISKHKWLAILLLWMGGNDVENAIKNVS